MTKTERISEKKLDHMQHHATSIIGGGAPGIESFAKDVHHLIAAYRAMVKAGQAHFQYHNADCEGRLDFSRPEICTCGKAKWDALVNDLESEDSDGE